MIFFGPQMDLLYANLEEKDFAVFIRLSGMVIAQVGMVKLVMSLSNQV